MLSLRCQTTLWWCRLPSYYYSLPKWFTHNNVIHACFIRYFPWPWSLNNHFATRIYAAESEVKLIWPRCTVRTIVHSCQRLRWFYKPLVSRGLTFDVACLLQWQTKLALKPLHIKNSLVKGIYIEKNASKLQSSFVDHTYGCSVKVSNSVFSANTVFLIQFGVGFFLLFATFSYFRQWPKGISDQHSWPNTTGKLFPSLLLLKGHFWKRKLEKNPPQSWSI